MSCGSKKRSRSTTPASGSPRTEFIAEVRGSVTKALADKEASTRLLHRQLKSELGGLDAQEDDLINLQAATDETLPTAKAKITAKLREIEYRGSTSPSAWVRRVGTCR
jgi:hypothetical protein